MALVQLNINRTLVNQMDIVPPWTGPGSVDLWIQSLAYASLGTSLLAAFGAVLGKQWLAHYKSTRFGRGTQEERGKLRHKRFLGLKQWQLEPMLDILPVLLQLSLGLFAISLTANIWILQQTLGCILIAVSLMGFLFYTVTLVIAIGSENTPFESIVSRFWRGVLSYLRGLMAVLALMLALISSGLDLPEFASKLRQCWSPAAWMELTRRSLKKQQDMEADGSSSITRKPQPKPLVLSPSSKITCNAHLHASAVCWILETSTEPEVLISAVRLVPSVWWSADLALRAYPIRRILGFESEVDQAASILNATLVEPYVYNWLSCLSDPDTALLQGVNKFDTNDCITDLHDIDLTIPWLSHLSPFLIDELATWDGLPRALEGCLTHESRFSALNGLTSMAILLDIKVDKDILRMVDKS